MHAMMKKKLKKKPSKAMAVEGGASRPRLDRPMRRAEGGPTISDDSKKEAARLRNEAEGDRRAAMGDALKGGAAILGGMALSRLGTRKAINAYSAGRSPSKSAGAMDAAGTGLAGVGAVGGAGSSFLKSARGAGKDVEASRIERGEAEPGKEDRKRGGKVCK